MFRLSCKVMGAVCKERQAEIRSVPQESSMIDKMEEEKEHLRKRVQEDNSDSQKRVARLTQEVFSHI